MLSSIFFGQFSKIFEMSKIINYTKNWNFISINETKRR